MKFTCGTLIPASLGTPPVLPARLPSRAPRPLGLHHSVPSADRALCCAPRSAMKPEEARETRRALQPVLSWVNDVLRIRECRWGHLGVNREGRDVPLIPSEPPNAITRRIVTSYAEVVQPCLEELRNIIFAEELRNSPQSSLDNSSNASRRREPDVLPAPGPLIHPLSVEPSATFLRGMSTFPVGPVSTVTATIKTNGSNMESDNKVRFALLSKVHFALLQSTPKAEAEDGRPAVPVYDEREKLLGFISPGATARDSAAPDGAPGEKAHEFKLWDDFDLSRENVDGLQDALKDHRMMKTGDMVCEKLEGDSVHVFIAKALRKFADLSQPRDARRRSKRLRDDARGAEHAPPKRAARG